MPDRPPSIFVVTVRCDPSAVIENASVTFAPVSGFETISMRPSFHCASTFVLPPWDRSSSITRPSVKTTRSRPEASAIVSFGSA